jgi:hypothetical protein
VYGGEVEKINKIAASVGLSEIPPRLMANLGKDPKPVADLILSKWLPLDRAVLNCVVAKLPDPIKG